MQIGIGATTIDPAITHGRMDGLGVYTKNLLTAMQKHQHDKIIPIVFPPVGKLNFQSQLPTSLVFPYSYPIANLINLLTLTHFDLNKKIAQQINLFHATDYRIPKFKNIPVVATIHDAIMLKHPQWCNPSMRQIKNRLLKISVKWANYFITGAKAMIPELVEYWGIPENKIAVVYHGVDNFWFERTSEEEKQAVLAKYNLTADFLLSVGTLQPRKNIERVITAFKQLPAELQKQHKLVIVGKNGYQTTALINELKQLVQEDKAMWLEYIALADLRALYQSAKVFLYPSLYEGFGLPILEAFAAKVPVITSKITAMPEVAGEAAYLVDPYEVEDLQKAMEKLLTDSILCQDYVAKGSERVKAFSWERCATETLQVYKKLV